MGHGERRAIAPLGRVVVPEEDGLEILGRRQVDERVQRRDAALLCEVDEAAAFEVDYAARVRAAYPPLADGRTLFPFRRLFIVAVR